MCILTRYKFSRREKTCYRINDNDFKTHTPHRVGLPRTCKRRSTTTIPRLVYTERSVFDANILTNTSKK